MANLHVGCTSYYDNACYMGSMSGSYHTKDNKLKFKKKKKPCSTTISRPQIAQLYLDNVHRWFGLLTKVILDQDP